MICFPGPLPLCPLCPLPLCPSPQQTKGAAALRASHLASRKTWICWCCAWLWLYCAKVSLLRMTCIASNHRAPSYAAVSQVPRHVLLLASKGACLQCILLAYTCSYCDMFTALSWREMHLSNSLVNFTAFREIYSAPYSTHKNKQERTAP